IWLATIVGRPMPRLTYMPSLSSCAARAAIWSRVQGMGLLLNLVRHYQHVRRHPREGGDPWTLVFSLYRPWIPAFAGMTVVGSHESRTHRTLLDPLLGVGVVDDAVDEDAGQVHLVRIDLAGLHDFLHFHHTNPAGHRAGRVE